MESLGRAIQETALFFVALVKTTFRSVRENSGLAALSVVLAFALWIFVTDAENPTSVRVMPEDVTVQPVNVPDDVAVDGQIPTVRVRVKVAEDVFESLDPADFEATVDLEGLTVGDYTLPVQVRTLTGRGGLTVEGVLPEEIDVHLARLSAKSVPVAIEVTGNPPSGYAMGTAVPSDDNVIVTGPEGQVDQVTQVGGTIDVTGKTEDIGQAVRLVAQTNRGILVPGVTLDPSIVQVEINISQERFSRVMAVSPEVTGVPEDGYNVVAVSVTPASVTVRGDQGFIEGTTTIPTDPVDVSGADEDVVRTVNLDLPVGAEVTGGVPQVTVTVRIEPALGVLSFTVATSATGLGDTVAIQGPLPSVVVALTGELPTLRALTPNDIGATLDLTDRAPGTFRLPVRIVPPAGLSVQSVTPAEVDVTLVAR
jgi:YbbR domain-containing protein